ncbi:MAG: hypothetical protein NTZ38_00635, partial [Candidatus Taylorbacteria bacterium]|nr:hypothetical protein [Candidatus Taylorbacteria bacterium]
MNQRKINIKAFSYLGLVFLALLSLAVMITYVITEKEKLSLPENWSVTTNTSTGSSGNNQPIFFITNVVRVFLHEYGHYSVMSKSENHHNLDIFDLEEMEGNTSIQMDVKNEMPMWLSFKKYGGYSKPASAII